MLTPGPLKRRVKYWQRRLNLLHWELDILIVDEFEHIAGALASCGAADDYDRATLKFRRDIHEQDDRENVLDYAIIHELLHLHARDISETIEAILGSLGDEAGTAYRKRWDHEEEGLVDRLTRIVLDLHK